MFPTSLLGLALLATTVLAAPSSNSRLSHRVAHRRGNLLQKVEAPQGNESTHPQYSSNWAGAVLVADTQTYTAVTGTFTVPTPSAPGGGFGNDYGSYAAAAWVGIDGDTCGNAILQTGVDFTVTDGEVSYDAWYEWYPDYAYDFSGIDINAGDQIRTTVTASSPSSGTAIIENLTTGQEVRKELSSQSSLCEYNAEWIVEDFEEGDSLVSFADFGTVTFTDAVATTNFGTVGPSGATILDIQQDTVLTSVSVGSSEVRVTYV